MRGNNAGDCYYNLGIILHLQKQYKSSLRMFDNAARLKELQFGEKSMEVADTYHNIALINQNLKNYKAAIENF